MEDAQRLTVLGINIWSEVGNSGLTQIIELRPDLETRLPHDLFNNGVLNKSELFGFTQHT